MKAVVIAVQKWAKKWNIDINEQALNKEFNNVYFGAIL